MRSLMTVTAAALVFFLSFPSVAETGGKTLNVNDIRQKHAGATPVVPKTTPTRPSAAACVAADKLDDAGEIISLPDYTGCSNEELGAMEATLHKGIDETGTALRPFALLRFHEMTQAGDAGRFAAARAALAQIRALRLSRNQGIQLTKGKCLNASEIQDPGAVALFTGYENCTGAQLRAMATLMFQSAFRDVRQVRPYAVKDFHGFTQAGAASRFGMSKGALALILQTMKQFAPRDFVQWQMTVRNTMVSAADLASPGAITSLIHYRGLTANQIAIARSTTQTALNQTARDLRPIAAGRFQEFTQSGDTNRLAMERSTLALLGIFSNP